MPTGTNLGVQQSDFLFQGSITTAGGPTDTTSFVAIVNGEGGAAWLADIRGTFSAGTALVFEGTADGLSWFPITGFQEGNATPALVTGVDGPGPQTYTGSASALQQVRVRATAINSGDVIAITLRLSVGPPLMLGGSGGGGGGTVNQGSPNTIGNAWTVAVTDRVNGIVAVKPGGTAAVVGDTSFVVALSPNTPLPAGSNFIGQVSFAPYTQNSQNDPTTGLQTNNLSSSGGPSPAGAQAPTNTACVYDTLGGEYWLKATIANENLLGVFAYQVPAGRTLYITNVILPPPVVTFQLGNGPFGQLWEMFIADGDNPSTATGTRFPLTTFGAQANAREGSNLGGGGMLQLSLQTPVVASGGEWVLICYKVVGTGSASGTFRGTCHINGYFA